MKCCTHDCQQDRTCPLRAENERLQKLLESILPHIKRAQEDFWDWQDEGPYGEGWRSKENVECYEAIYDWIVEARQALKGKEMSDLTCSGCGEYAGTHISARIEELEAKLAKAVGGFEELARLGNGDRYGNSFGNLIAQKYIAELTGGKDE